MEKLKVVKAWVHEDECWRGFVMTKDTKTWKENETDDNSVDEKDE